MMSTFVVFRHRAGFYEFGDQDFVWMTHPMRQEPDRVSTGRSYVGMSSHIPLAENASSGDWYYNNVSKELTYIVSGRRSRELVDQNVDLNVSETWVFLYVCVEVKKFPLTLKSARTQAKQNTFV